MSLCAAEPEVGGLGRRGKLCWLLVEDAYVSLRKHRRSAACVTAADHSQPGLALVSARRRPGCLVCFCLGSCSWGRTQQLPSQMATCDSSRSKNAREPRNLYYVPLNTFPIKFRGLGSSHQPSNKSSGNREIDLGLGVPRSHGNGCCSCVGAKPVVDQIEVC